MNSNMAYVKECLNTNLEYRTALFEQGFLLTNRKIQLTEEFPFFSNWREVVLEENVHLYLHKHQNGFLLRQDGCTYFLIGHAYDPFEKLWDENNILNRFSEMAKGVFQLGIPYINQLTGLFVIGLVTESGIACCGDFESLRTTYYGAVNGNWYVSSHEELVALYEPLHRDPYVERLESYRWYHFYGEGLPGDDSHYIELKKLMSNHYVRYENGVFSMERFFPLCPIEMKNTQEGYEETIQEIAQILQSTLELISKKWDKPAISVTGGRDSKGTLAAAYHIKERFQYFSYDSQPAERVDCEAAEQICSAIGVSHKTYKIPLEQDVYPEYSLVKAILCVNSNRRYFNHNDIMKRIFFRKEKPIQIEVKSWTSEIGRALFYRKYGVKRMPKRCTARRVNAMNNVYLFHPKLMYETDARYRNYLKKTAFVEHMFNYDWTDFVKLELRNSRWGADVVSCEHMFAYDITIPYNNRRLAMLMLSLPLEDRIQSKIHIHFTDLLCPAIGQTNINVRDVAHGKRREWMDKLYFFITSMRPL